MDVAFNRPYTGENERRAVAQAVQQEVLHGDGPIAERVQEQMERWLDIAHVFLTTSCTHALEMAMITLGIGPGDEVIMPSFNFVSSANAVVLRGATPVFAEIRPGTMNVDVEDVQRRVTARTKAIVPVHYAGVACDMEAIMALADAHDLYVVEDAAQGVDAYWNGEPLGTIGHIGCYSFHDTKNITCGEGGAFLTNDPELARKAEIVREKGTNRSAFYRGEVDKYSWVEKGSSYIQSDVLAALLEAQLARRDEIKAKRRAVWTAYYEALQPLAEDGLIAVPEVPGYAQQNYHILFFHTRTLEERTAVLQVLKDKGIHATFHYVPLHSSPFGREMLESSEALPTTSHYSNTLLRLPVYPQLEEKAPRIAEVVATTVREALSVPLSE